MTDVQKAAFGETVATAQPGRGLGRHRSWLICVALALSTLAVFWPVTQNDFITEYDDQEYVVENIAVNRGFTWQGVGWAFTAYHASNWHPVTWLSHMLDCQLFGVKAGPHHLVNATFHAVNAVLLFLLLAQMTGAVWRSASVAALFALHPLHVESVAWISERKDVLSTLFFLLTLWAYARYVQLSKGRNPKSRFHYLLSLLWFACGLMSKPMLVTLPFVLLLLDFWPLARLTHAGFQTPLRSCLALLREKLPFFALSAASCVLTLGAQRDAMPTLDFLPLSDRTGNALVACVRYLGKTFWPSELAVFYPHVGTWPTWQVTVAGALLLGVTAVALGSATKRAYWPVGWFWFLGTLVPVIGIVQVGSQAMADRYSYIPLIGLFVIAVWTVAEAFQKWRYRAAALGALSATVLLALAVCTTVQLRYWKNSETLFRHAMAVTRNNITACFSLGNALINDGRVAEGMGYLLEALRLKPDFADVRAKVAEVLTTEGKFDEAIAHYEEALKAKPDLSGVLNNLAWLRATHPDPKYRDGQKAVRLAERACELTRYQKTIFIGTLAAAYAEAGRFDDAVRTAQRARERAESWGESKLAAKNRELIELYKTGRPYRENAYK